MFLISSVNTKLLLSLVFDKKLNSLSLFLEISFFEVNFLAKLILLLFLFSSFKSNTSFFTLFFLDNSRFILFNFSKLSSCFLFKPDKYSKRYSPPTFIPSNIYWTFFIGTTINLARILNDNIIIYKRIPPQKTNIIT